MQAPVMVVLASRDRHNVALARYCLGARYDAGSGKVVVLVPGERCAPLLASIGESGAAALLLSEPTTLRSFQVKGQGATLDSLEPIDGTRAAAYLELIVPELMKVGEEVDWIRAAFAYNPEKLARISFEPTAVYAQTPGPRAGDRIQSAAS